MSTDETQQSGNPSMQPTMQMQQIQMQQAQMQQQQMQLHAFWQSQIRDIQRIDPDEEDFKTHQLPLARIKKIMKSDEDVRMISAEAPVLFAKACEMFILELTLRSWIHTEENKRRTLQRNDIAMAITKTDIFDFLIDIVPRDDIKPTKKVPADQAYYYMQQGANTGQHPHANMNGMIDPSLVYQQQLQQQQALMQQYLHQQGQTPGMNWQQQQQVQQQQMLQYQQMQQQQQMMMGDQNGQPSNHQNNAGNSQIMGGGNQRATVDV